MPPGIIKIRSRRKRCIFTIHFYAISFFLKSTCITFQIHCFKQKKKTNYSLFHFSNRSDRHRNCPICRHRWLERMNLGWCQMHPLKMIWLTIFLTWLMRQASPTGRDLLVKCSVAGVGYTYFSHGERGQGYCGTDTAIPPTLLFLLFLLVCPFILDKLSLSSIWDKLKFATILDHIFLLFVCSNTY